VEAKGEPALLLLTTLRWAETPEDQALTDAGWSLPAPYLAGWGMLAVDGASSYDGMCRPLGYNGFVFVAGIFAGTISPDLMDSRTTGAGTITSLQNGRVNARYVRCHRFEQARPLRLAALRIALYAHMPTSTRARCVAPCGPAPALSGGCLLRPIGQAVQNRRQYMLTIRSRLSAEARNQTDRQTELAEAASQVCTVSRRRVPGVITAAPDALCRERDVREPDFEQ
jgi:hypothetical protein